MINLLGLILSICLESSLPIDPPAPVINTFLLLIQLFKQDEGEAIDVHSFTCLSGIGDERTTNNAKMNYSWQYAYSNEEANSLDKRIGPDCERPVCPQSEGDINDKLIELGKGEFIVDSVSYSNEQNRHPKSKQIIYTKSGDNTNITIYRGYIEPTGITVKCRDRQERTRQIYCKYNEAYVENKLNYDESIRQLNPNDCYDTRLHHTILDRAVEPRPVEVTQVCGAALKFDYF